MKYIVFGGGGFLGRHLINFFKENEFNYLSCDLSVKKDTQEQIKIDIRSLEDLHKIQIEKNDVVINLAANQYHLPVPRHDVRNFFFETNSNGSKNVLEFAFQSGCKNAILFTTDMIYGKPQYLPVDERHPKNPFGFYGSSKKIAEDHALYYREKGMNITIFRPRLILGPGRLGILKKLFRLIDHDLPVPLIGNGENHYQMISVFDCVSAIELAIRQHFPNMAFNLGSYDPPNVKMLLKGLISKVNSRSFLLPIPGRLIKPVLRGFEFLGAPLMYKEQYMIADEEYIVDISLAEKKLGWKPRHSDEEMLLAAYNEYKKGSRYGA